jgi:integrase
MAEVYRPTYTATDPATGKRVKRKSRTWHIRFYTPDGQRHRVKGYRDRRATASLAAELEREAEHNAEGSADRKLARRPLMEHLADYRRHLEAKNNHPRYVGQAVAHCQAILDGAGFVLLRDVSAESTLDWLAEQRGQGMSLSTANHYIRSLKSFAHWVGKRCKAPRKALADLALFNAGEDIRRSRRALEVEEIRWLLQTTGIVSDDFRGLAGADRQILYAVALGTGFRASELRSVRPESFDLKGDCPTATVAAAHSKNRKESVQPLPVHLIEPLRAFLARKETGKSVWPGMWYKVAFRMIAADMGKAREEWLAAAHDAPERARRESSDFLAVRDRQGRVIDFHSLRHTYLTMLDRPGISKKAHQELARHSSYSLTERYTHARLHDKAAAVDALPEFLSVTPQTEALAATGTEGKKLSPNLVPYPAISGDFLRQAETEIANPAGNEKPGNHVENTQFPGIGLRVGDRTRTGDIQIHRRAIPFAEKHRNPRYFRSLSTSGLACKRVRAIAKNIEETRKFRASAEVFRATKTPASPVRATSGLSDLPITYVNARS